MNIDEYKEVQDRIRIWPASSSVDQITRLVGSRSRDQINNQIWRTFTNIVRNAIRLQVRDIKLP